MTERLPEEETGAQSAGTHRRDVLLALPIIAQLVFWAWPDRTEP